MDGWANPCWADPSEGGREPDPVRGRLNSVRGYPPGPAQNARRSPLSRVDLSSRVGTRCWSSVRAALPQGTRGRRPGASGAADGAAAPLAVPDQSAVGGNRMLKIHDYQFMKRVGCGQALVSG
ncbi:hypothetical protein Ais01nite_73120 [Asanoa ishikariensis]|nr:hypothetical protein Ais01nite_73120 [Asanoa ishikariensis]